MRYLTSSWPFFPDDGVIMVEILWKTNAPHLPIEDQDICEIRLVDFGSTVNPRFVIREIHAFWSAAAQQICWDGFQDQACRTPAEATFRYQSRRAAMVDAGFAHTALVG
ncbi:MAG TPA: hypothetical protein VGL00_14140 [Terracidiphilus sp.]